MAEQTLDLPSLQHLASTLTYFSPLSADNPFLTSNTALRRLLTYDLPSTTPSHFFSSLSASHPLVSLLPEKSLLTRSTHSLHKHYFRLSLQLVMLCRRRPCCVFIWVRGNFVNEKKIILANITELCIVGLFICGVNDVLVGSSLFGLHLS